MPVTIKKIAELAGVSAGTVDRVLNNRGRVKPEVEKRVRKIAEELDYRPNQIGRSLSLLSRSFRISVILHTEGNLYFDYVLHGVKRAAEELLHSKCTVDILYGRDFNAEYQKTQIEKAVSDGANAIVIVPIEDQIIRDKLRSLREENFPVFLLTNPLSESGYCEYVGCNYYEAGNLAAGVVSLLGKRNDRIAFFSPSFRMLGHRLRYDGFMNNGGLNALEMHTDCIELTDGGRLSTYGAAYDYFANHPDTSVIVSNGEGLYGGVLKAVEDSGLSSRVKIVAYDLSSHIEKMMEEKSVLVCIDQSPEEQGYIMIKKTFDALFSGKYPSGEDSYIPLRILIRESLSENVNSTAD